MNLIALDIPESRPETVAWLEAHIMGVQLGELVAELQAVHGNRADSLSLTEVCVDRLDSVMEFGLKVLESTSIEKLLTQPQLLIELQEAVFQRGGPHWFSLPETREQSMMLASQWKLIQSEVSLATTATSRAPASRSRFGRTMAVAILSAAATFAMAFLFRDAWIPPAAPTGWGWDKPGALAVTMPPRDYLNHLADGAQDWFKKRPDDKVALAKRIAQFRQGCSTLLLADHPSLADADREWLRERCRAWATKLDGHLVAIEKGEDVTTVRDAADETINKLIKALRDRAPSAV